MSRCSHWRLVWLPVPIVGLGARWILGCADCCEVELGYIDDGDIVTSGFDRIAA